MSYSARIDLENTIFARADRVQATVDAVAGGLVSSSKDPALQRLIELYNATFRAANFHDFCTPLETLEPLQRYVETQNFLPGLGCILTLGSLNFELMVARHP